MNDDLGDLTPVCADLDGSAAVRHSELGRLQRVQRLSASSLHCVPKCWREFIFTRELRQDQAVCSEFFVLQVVSGASGSHSFS